ncbi:hypothetical protein BaRGS_00035842 [Batillaria attramentaria]|uniref:Uncharacterized protein n=1 Tax=Batillaria attramentaria TaxID=370345 RepID=A0ABD0JDJ4_9CAEN
MATARTSRSTSGDTLSIFIRATSIWTSPSIPLPLFLHPPSPLSPASSTPVAPLPPAPPPLTQAIPYGSISTQVLPAPTPPYLPIRSFSLYPGHPVRTQFHPPFQCPPSSTPHHHNIRSISLLSLDSSSSEYRIPSRPHNSCFCVTQRSFPVTVCVFHIFWSDD